MADVSYRTVWSYVGGRAPVCQPHATIDAAYADRDQLAAEPDIARAWVESAEWLPVGEEHPLVRENARLLSLLAAVRRANNAALDEGPRRHAIGSLVRAAGRLPAHAINRGREIYADIVAKEGGGSSD
ncbi:hypothetical protein [Kineosporia succinea]|uniref:Uncharacterized protein n=1 Tax=Kineosporia succinea TaxID=84632 RepID=A0ABT9P9J0_9ACTN|nr:hypothetical protein [Kineosporia succinea]MDP9829361.1 hypothetical protein [Kineosporia succinea]